MAKSDLFNDYYINLMPIISKTACATKKLLSKKVTSAKFCNNKVPSTLQYNVWSSFRSHLTDENSKSTSPLFSLYNNLEVLGIQFGSFVENYVVIQ